MYQGIGSAQSINSFVCCRAINCDTSAICLKVNFSAGVSESLSVSDNQESGETQRAIDLKIYSQSYIIHMLVGIENGLYWCTGSGTARGFGGLRTCNIICNHRITPKSIFILTYIHMYTLHIISEISYIGPQGPDSTSENQLYIKKNFAENFIS